TVTLLFMLNNLLVGYLPIPYNRRVGTSKVRMVRDSLRSLQIIVTTIAQFNPLKIFLLLIPVNLIGNAILAVSAFFAEWNPLSLWMSVIAWNMVCLLGAVATLDLTMIK